MTVYHDPDSYMTTEEVAAFLSMSVVSIVKWRQGGKGPAFTKFGADSKRKSAVRYRRGDVIHFAETGEPKEPVKAKAV